MLDDKCMEELGKYIQKNKNIETIDIGSNKITDTGIEILAPFIDETTSLQTFNISFCFGVTDKSIPLLIQMIQKSRIIDLISSQLKQDPFIVPLLLNKIRYGNFIDFNNTIG